MVSFSVEESRPDVNLYGKAGEEEDDVAALGWVWQGGFLRASVSMPVQEEGELKEEHMM